MSRSIRIRNPFVVASLPRPLNRQDGRTTARRVFGVTEEQQHARRRPEVVVGVDGEAVCIYHLPTSRLVTSYPISPEEFLTCPPVSVRTRGAARSERARYTYIATRSLSGAQVRLFKDVTAVSSGSTESTTAVQKVPFKERVVHVEVLLPREGARDGSCAGRLLLVGSSGTVACLDGESLSVIWTESCLSLLSDVLGASAKDMSILYTHAPEKTREGKKEHKAGEVNGSHAKLTGGSKTAKLALVASIKQKRGSTPLYILLDVSGASSIHSQNLVPLQISPFDTSANDVFEGASFQLDAASGTLSALRDETLHVFDVSGSAPKLLHHLPLPDAKAFIHLSGRSVLVCGSDSLSIYNHVLRSLQSRKDLDAPLEKEEKAEGGLGEVKKADKRPVSYQLIDYSRQSDQAVLLVGKTLYGVPIEVPVISGTKRRIGDLLIDSIGRGEPLARAAARARTGQQNGYATPDADEEMAAASKMLEDGQMVEFEQLLARKFGVRVRTQRSGKKAEDGSAPGEARAWPLEWMWLEDQRKYPAADRRWVSYAIDKALAFAFGNAEAESLAVHPNLPTPNVLLYLVVAGHLTLSNTRAACRAQLAGRGVGDGQLARELVRVIAGIDPSLDLLVAYVSSTRLDAPELVLALKEMMESLGLVQQARRKEAKMLTQEPHEDEAAAADDEEMLDRLEEEIELTQRYLDDDQSGTRARGLTVALSKLSCCPAAATVRSLRTMLDANEVLSLMAVLRVELVRGSWTSRYSDTLALEETEAAAPPPPDGVISVISLLLARCLDALGPRGWLVHDGVRLADSSEATEFLSALKLEVQAALEGLEEAVYLNGIVGEALRYVTPDGEGEAASAPAGTTQPDGLDTTRPIRLELAGGQERSMLPLSCRPSWISTRKVVSGGEVVQRSAREMGHLRSQQVQAYSLEKLAI